MTKSGKQYTDEDKARWHAQYEDLLARSVPQEAADALALALFTEGRGKQFSRRYRMIATLPVGESALRALKRCSRERYRAVVRRAEVWAADDYATYCAEKDGQLHTLDMRTFAAFKKLENGREWTPKESDLRQTEELYGLSDPKREAGIRRALAELDAKRAAEQPTK